MTRAEKILKDMLPPDATVWAYKDKIVEAMDRYALKMWLDSPSDDDLHEWFYGEAYPATS